MQDNNTARKKVYDVLRDKTGYSDSYEDFNKFMDENEEARKKVYDVLKDKTGYSDSYEDFNQFMQPVDSSVQIQQPNNTPQTQSLITFKQATDMTLFQEHIQVVSEHRRKRTGFLI